MKIEKGQPGYIKARKMRYLMFAVGEFAIVAAVFFLGYQQTGSRMNLFTVAAAVGCLPAAKMLVEFITMAPYQSISREKYLELEEKAALLTRAYDLIITSKEKVMSVDALVISGHVVCGYTSSTKTDETTLARHIKTTLKNNRYDKMTVKIFHDYHAFLARVEGLGNIAAVQQPDQRRDRSVRKIIYSISM
ncbi:hypothetical protein [uncultured Merdimonas sp.]|uniref:hypothetical protein n=1 Tax=uncultured Merdimonas sp. TaxID=2023269 RepID=UPI0032091E1C